MIGRRQRRDVDEQLVELDRAIRRARQAQLDAGTNEARMRALDQLNRLLDVRLQLMGTRR